MENKIDCNIRENVTKGNNHRLRVSGKIPGILYGLRESNMNVEFAEMELFHTLEKVGEHGMVELNTNGMLQKAIIKDIQRDPVSRKLMHIDLQRVDENKKIHAHIPVVIKGEEGLRVSDAVVQKAVDDVEVEGMPGKLPKFFTIDVTNMLPGRRITYNDLEVSEEISIVGDINTIVATIAKIKENKQNTDEQMLGYEPPKEER